MGLTNNKRGKSRYKMDYGLRDCFKFYKQKGGFLEYPDFRKVYEKYIKNVMYHIIEKSADYRMPGRLGDIGIRKKKIKMFINDDGELEYRNRKPNWGDTLKLWEKKYGTLDKEELKKIKNKPIVYFDNEHTNGYTFFIAWDKRTCNAKHQSKYIFVGSRGFSRAIPKVQDDKKIDYYESDNGK